MKKILDNLPQEANPTIQTWTSLKNETDSILEKLKIKRLAVNDEIRKLPSGQSDLRTAYNTYRNALNKLISDSEKVSKKIPIFIELYKDSDGWEKEKSFIELRSEFKRISQEYFNPHIQLPIKGEKHYESLS